MYLLECGKPQQYLYSEAKLSVVGQKIPMLHASSLFLVFLSHHLPPQRMKQLSSFPALVIQLCHCVEGQWWFVVLMSLPLLWWWWW